MPVAPNAVCCLLLSSAAPTAPTAAAVITAAAAATAAAPFGAFGGSWAPLGDGRERLRGTWEKGGQQGHWVGARAGWLVELIH